MVSRTFEVWFWIIFWFTLNLGITLLNKAVFSHAQFMYPTFLTFVHMVLSWFGGYVSILGGVCKSKELSRGGNLLMYTFSFLFTANIIVGNVSLRHVSVSFNQVVRALVPAFTMLFSFFLLKERFSYSRQVSMMMVVVGVMIACYGDIEFTMYGFWITLLAVITAAAKAAVSSLVLTGENKLHPIDLLHRMSWLSSFQCIAWSYVSGEMAEIQQDWNNITRNSWILVIFTGVIAFFLNIASFYVNKVTSALTLTIVGNVKQILVIIMAVIIFQTPITPLNLTGVVIVIVGSAWYSYVGHVESQSPKKIEPIPEVSIQDPTPHRILISPAAPSQRTGFHMNGTNHEPSGGVGGVEIGSVVELQLLSPSKSHDSAQKH